jgi:hypothetical protein
MSKSNLILFSLRLFFYFSVISLILIHPGISVSFDRIGIMQWFVIIPLMAIIAVQSVYKLNSHKRWLLALVLLVPLSVIAGGFGPGAFIPFAAGLVSFILALLLFNYHGIPFYARLNKIAALEPFFMTWVCLRLLILSRSSEEIAGQSMVLTQFILVWAAAVFLFHSAVIYLCLYPQSRAKSWREGLVLSFGTLAVIIILIAVLPPDFVRNAIIENLNPDRIPQRINQTTDNGLPMRGGGRRTLPQDGNRRGDLRGLSEHNWHNRGGGDPEESRQYMVKIVASEREPVYMGDSFRGHLDPVYGFLLSPDEPLNELARQRFFVTWFDSERDFDLRRERQEVFSLSTLRQKYLPYRPVAIDPTILNENAGPLRYIHQVVSNTHIDDPLFLVYAPTRHFYSFERTKLAPYLEIPLEYNDKREFEAFLNNALVSWRLNRETIINSDSYLQYIFSNRELIRQDSFSGNEYLETIIAILVSFSEYQYNLIYDDDYSIAALKDFLFNTKEGDCVEFSNTLALLGRLAGIPSRVVTGYLAAESLQTPAHLRGLALLRSRIPFLQRFPFDNLFMVTNLHSHSWTQFYIPDYGWLDFEATSFAIPPVGMGDFNEWDVVIPLIDENRTFSQVRKFPWQAVGRAVIAILIIALVCAYILRYGRELFLFFNSRNNVNYRTRTRSLYLLLLARLAADGQPIKPASKTAHEYSQLFANSHMEPTQTYYFQAFADIYSELRWREFKNQSDIDERLHQLKQEYLNILKNTRRRGIHRWFIRIINLKGLAYL